MIAYATDNSDRVIVLQGVVPNTLSDPGVAEAKQVGLTADTGGTTVWVCPNRKLPATPPTPTMPFREANATGFQWTIGYSYFGGLTNWTLPTGGIPLRGYSPIKLGNSKPHWVLAADSLYKSGGIWNSERAASGTARDRQLYNNIPSHPTPRGNGLAGANHLFVDGSAAWRTPQKYPYYAFTSWAGVFGTAWVYWAQETHDIPTGSPLANALPGVRLAP